MANEINKRTVDEVVEQSTTIEADGAVRELMETVEALPRTDHMTLPAVGITVLDEETASRMRAIAAVNAASDPNTVIDENGKTLQEVRNEFTYGVTDLEKGGLKHSFETVTDANGNTGIKVTAPEINGIKDEGVVISATPSNIAPIDVDAPKNPVEAAEAGADVPAPARTPVANVPLDKRGSDVAGTTTASPAVTPTPTTNSMPSGDGTGNKS